MQRITKNIIVTGSNKGIGLGIVSCLSSKTNWNIIMACRKVEMGNKAKEQILKKHPSAKINVERLDLSDDKSIDNFRDVVFKKYGTIDVLVNNAGVRNVSFTHQVFKQTFQTNVYGQISLTQKILPSIAQMGKIIIIGASYFKLSLIKNASLKEVLQKDTLTKDELISTFDKFEQSVKLNNCIENGWPKQIYGMSKLAITLYAKILGRDPKVLQNQIQVNALCPGMVKTELSKNQGSLNIEKAGQNIVNLIEKEDKFDKQLQGHLIARGSISSVL